MPHEIWEVLAVTRCILRGIDRWTRHANVLGIEDTAVLRLNQSRGCLSALPQPKGCAVKRINAQFFYTLSSSLRPLNTLAVGEPILNHYGVLWEAERELLGYLMNDVAPPAACAGSGWNLRGSLRSLLDDFVRDAPLAHSEVSNIKSLLVKFENNLEAEYSQKDLFVVSPKGIYSTSDLIDSAEQMFSREFQDRMPQAIRDLKEAGRCIAFEVPTAAAFHIFRAVEAVAKDYVLVMRGFAPTDKEKRGGLGRFVVILNENGADERVTSAISQLAKLHRNPTMHPQMFIENTEILATLGMAQSVIQGMIADMEKKQPTPSQSVMVVLPEPKALAYESEKENDPDPDEEARQMQLSAGGED